MPPLSILNNQAFLVSPLEIPVYLLKLSPGPKGSGSGEALLEGEIRNQLKALYPGAPEDTVIDYALCPGGKKTAPRMALVHVSSRPTIEMYRDLRRPLIPGTTLMRIAMRKAGVSSAFCVIAAEEWAEAAFFEGPLVLRYGSCPAPSGRRPPFSFIASFVNSGEGGPAAALFIRAGSPNEQNEETKKILRQFFDPVIKVDINEIAPKSNLRSLGIFNGSRSRSLARQKRITRALLLLNGLSLLLSLHNVAKQTKLELSSIEKQERALRQTLERAKALESAITETPARDGAKNHGGGADPYGMIAGLQSCLSGGWIKSLVIQGDNFDLEAEGVDSIGALQSLQTSGHFGDLSLRRASSSPISGDQFAISGRVERYGKQ
jgi:hypothetical protein